MELKKSKRNQINPLVTLVTAVYNDSWALTKTLRSISEQSARQKYLIEVVVVDGGSTDGTISIVEFWKNLCVVDKCISEPDHGVYDAMMKGVKCAEGHYICFMNAGDVFYDQSSLQIACGSLVERPETDALLGWGRLGERIQGAWISHPAFAMASMGFCHQALFMRKTILSTLPFDTRKFKTDSDAAQLGDAIKAGFGCEILPKVLVNRSTDQGISADEIKTAKSISESIMARWPELTEPATYSITEFRRNGVQVENIINLLECCGDRVVECLILVVLDTLTLVQGRKISDVKKVKLLEAIEEQLRLRTTEIQSEAIERCMTVTTYRRTLEEQYEASKAKLRVDNENFGKEVSSFLRKNRAVGKGVIPITLQLTSFPARISSVPKVIESLLNQTLLAERFVLCLGKDEFPRKDWLPTQLLDYEDAGLIEIHLADKTFHQYDKFLHCNFEIAKPLVIVDDDVIYLNNTLEYLWEQHLASPDCVIANRANEIQLNGVGIARYSDWRREVSYEHPTHRLMATGAGGVLYPEGFFSDHEAFNQKRILREAPYADDVWLKKIALLQNRKIKTSAMLSQQSWYHRYTPFMEKGALHNFNVGAGLNDRQIEACDIPGLLRVRLDDEK